MKSLLTRLMEALRALAGPAPLRPTRVGLLNTGELVLIDGLGRAEVVSQDTTGLIRDTLTVGSPALTGGQ